MKARQVRAVALLALGAWPAAPARAHRLDEMLQAALVSVNPDGIGLYLTLTPGVQVAEALIATLDTDRSGDFSPEELRAYGRKVLAPLRLTLDGRPLTLRPGEPDASSLAELRAGLGVILVVAKAATGPLAPGSHRLEFETLHAPAACEYLANALRPSSSAVSIDGQERDPRQTRLLVTYTLRADTPR